jgi:aminopeptidase YwaD
LGLNCALPPLNSQERHASDFPAWRSFLPSQFLVSTMPSPSTPKPYAALPLLWAAIMLVLTLTPAAEMPNTPHWELLSFDTAAHAGVFAVLAVLSWFSLRRQSRWPALARQAGPVVMVICVLFGGLIEILQYVMHLGRQAEWTDLLGDSLGAALALLVVGGGWRWWHRRRLATPLLLLLLLLSSSIFFVCPARAQQPDLARARRTIATLASPNMHGRGYVKDGDHKAAAYLRGRMQKLGLEPLAPNYTQPFTLDVNTFPGKMKLRLSHGYSVLFGPHWKLKAGRDFIAAPSSASGRVGNGRRLFYLDSSSVNNAASIQGFLRDSRYPGTAVLLDRYVQQAANLPAVVRTRLDSVGAVLRIVPKLTASLAPTQGKTIQLEALDHPMLHQFKPSTGSPAWTAGVRVDAELKRAYPTQNLAAIVRGSTQPDSFLVVTAHYDHLGMMGKKVYFPGANDNASGVALLLELATHYARPENRPAYSVVFLLFGAEEAGLIGSSYFVAHPLVPLRSIKFLVNLDLLGTGEEGATTVNGKVYESAYQRLTALNNAQHFLPRLTARGRAANSDHFPFSEAGVPAFFLYTRGGSQAYHDINDKPAALSLVGFTGAFGLVRDFLDELGARPK